jgi:hypothetical protein
MKTMQVGEVKSKFSEVLEQVSAGERIINFLREKEGESCCTRSFL